MRLPPKPSARDNRQSHAGTSTQHTATVASPTGTTQAAPAGSTPETPRPQAASTPNLPTGEVKTLILTADPSILSEAEKKELSNLGEFLAKMPWLKLFAQESSFREGVNRGGGQVHQVDDLSPGAYNAIIVYRVLPKLKSRHNVAVANIQDINRLRKFTDEAVKDLYRRGIIL